MPSVEGLYVVNFGDVALPGQQYRNGGVAVLETNRIYGGDSGYYYVGTFEAQGNRVEATAKVVKHDPTWMDAWGDNSTSFTITLQGNAVNGVIAGTMTRVDTRQRLPIRLTWKEALP